MHVDAWLPRAAAAHAERAALVGPGGTVTYAALLARARAGSAALRTAGVAVGDRVALALPPGVDFAVALHACLLLGAPAVPLDLRLTEAERAVRAAGAAVVVTAPLAGAGDAAEDPIFGHDLEAVATVMHTSGTTAAPRPVPLTFGNWAANAAGSAAALGRDPDERWLCPLPLAHVGGLSILLRSAIYGTTVVVHERFDADAVAAALTQDAITLVSLVPTMLDRVLAAGLERPPTLRHVLLGGGPIPPSLLERAAAAGIPVAPTYGMTEGCSQIATFGRPLDGVRIEIAPDGEILVAGPTVSAEALASDGWLHTGDLGTLDPDGTLSVTGRKADTIVSGGENVAPAEVEAVLLEHPIVADAAVHARPDPEWGEAVVATIVLVPGAEPDESGLRAHCAARLAPFKVPKAFEFAPRLPRTDSGKLLRRML